MKKKIALYMLLASFSVLEAKAQTATELIGKWKLVKWTRNGEIQDIHAVLKADSIYQVFNDDNKFISIVGTKETNGKWKLSKDNTQLTVGSGLAKTDFKIDFFDTKKRIISNNQLGTLEYQKVN